MMMIFDEEHEKSTTRWRDDDVSIVSWIHYFRMSFRNNEFSGMYQSVHKQKL